MRQDRRGAVCVRCPGGLKEPLTLGHLSGAAECQSRRVQEHGVALGAAVGLRAGRAHGRLSAAPLPGVRLADRFPQNVRILRRAAGGL